MAYLFRDEKMDVVIAQGPRVKQWPTAGVRVLSRLLSDAGFRVGWYGGPGMRPRGVIPHSGSGGVFVFEDAQSRIHRVETRALVKILSQDEFPDPFRGWYSPGLVPLRVAKKLFHEASLSWQNVTLILGTGNPAVEFGIQLLESGKTQRVVCLESVFSETQCFEVIRRRFEILGGRFVFGKPAQFAVKTSTQWQFKVEDQHGLRLFDVARVVSAGPFQKDYGFREYPQGSFLFSFSQSEASEFREDVQGISLDEERAVVLASKIQRGLSQGNSLDSAVKVAKNRLKILEWRDQNPEERFSFEYEGKWIHQTQKEMLQSFPGNPGPVAEGRILATIDCVETIGCRLCESSCPANAIDIQRTLDGSTTSFLKAADCTGCGQCLKACPSQIPVMIQGGGSESAMTMMYLPYRHHREVKKGSRVALLNRRGEVLSQSRVLDEFLNEVPRIFKVEVPSHLVEDVRAFLPLPDHNNPEPYQNLYQEVGARVEVQIQGVSRRVRDGQNLGVSLFELGVARPNDILLCEDGSCGLCQVEVDGVRKLACQTQVRQGMSIRYTRDHEVSSDLCPCEQISEEYFRKKIEDLKPRTLEAMRSLCTAGQGRCHGALCGSQIQKCAASMGLENSEGFLSWDFPWTDWMWIP